MKDENINSNELHFNKRELLDIVGNNEEFIKILLKTYTDGFWNYYKEIIKAVRNYDQDSLRLNAHSLKGASLSVCMTTMANLANELENTKFDDIEKINDLIEEIELEFQIIKEIIS